jgi:hypothetical protein
MSAALATSGSGAAARLLNVGYHDHDVRYHHSAEDVPDGLHIPKWSWDGRVG